MIRNVLVTAITLAVVITQANATTRNVAVASLYFRDEVSQTSTSIINVNDSIRWFWEGGFHTTTSTTKLWNSDIDPFNTEFTFQFTQRGVYEYFCRPHFLDMQGTIYVLGNPVVVLPTSFNVDRGTHRSGGVSDLFDSDNSYIVIDQRPPFTPVDPSARLFVEGTATDVAPVMFTVLLEANSNFGPSSNATQRLEAFNFADNRWDTLDERNPSTTDQVIEIKILQNPARYIQPGTQIVRARVGIFDRGSLFPNWSLRVDRFVWITN